MPNRVVHFEVVARDQAAMRDFYGKVFDWDIGAPMAEANGYAMARPAGDGGIAGGIGAAPEGYDGHTTFYVEVPDVDAALRTIESLGGKVMMPKEDVPNGPTIALFTDPEGHVVGLVEVKV